MAETLRRLADLVEAHPQLVGYIVKLSEEDLTMVEETIAVLAAEKR